MNLRHRGYLVEAGKSISIQNLGRFPKDRDDSSAVASHRKDRRIIEREIEDAVKKVLTWTDDKMTGFFSKHSVIRMEVQAAGKPKYREYIFQVYDRNSGEGSPSFTANVRMRNDQATTGFGDFKSVAAANKAVKAWFTKEAKIRFPTKLERISFKSKNLSKG